MTHGSKPKRIAPGPRGHWLLGNLREFRRDVLGLIVDSAREFGDVVRFRLGTRVVHLLNHPDHAEYVLVRNARNFDKRTRSAQLIKAITGEGLLTSNGEFWQRQRRLLQPAFHHRNIAGFATEMTAATAAMLERWRECAVRGETLDVASEMMRLTYTIVGRTLFNFDAGPDAEMVERAMQIILPHAFGRLGGFVNAPEWLPTPANRRFRSALSEVDRVVYRIVAQRRRAQDTGALDGDLISMLLRVRDGETGSGFSDEQLRNEAITFLLAGHETTANALAWTFYLLAQHPESGRRISEEVAATLGGRAPTLEDLARLPFTKSVIKEAMRLYPPIWIIERRVVRDDAVGGFFLPAGSAVVIAPYALHRHPGFWDRPDEFNPSRFAASTPPAYIPFGVGPRFCIGSEFAMLEAQLVVSMVVQAFRLETIAGRQVLPLPGITLRMRGGMWMRPRGTSHS
ncbi:MAG: cytochrome P450 [Opitutaceae bacterium]